MHTPQNPLISQQVQLKKFPGKGGWTYAPLIGLTPNKKNHFGWVRVSGFIDDYEIKQYNLMPMGDGKLFIAVKAEIRKKIKKGEGDWVTVVLFEDNTPQEVPEEFAECLNDDPIAAKNFKKLSDFEKKRYIEWIYGAKTEDIKVERMAEAINRITREEKLI